ncbi:MAG: MerR family transcriptional regulator, partial [Actinobacteria bacterium]|nr:MerR family transcriptional regulator [Actinomycetota bacterium]
LEAASAPVIPRRWKVGELAAATGVPARTLHFFDEIGLLVPSERTQSGPRLYTDDDVRRLYRIVVLRRLGHPLRRTSVLLGEAGPGLLETVRAHLDHVEQDREGQRSLHERLLEISGALERGVEPSADQFVHALAASKER